ncbi:uncharacterized protein LOC110847445 [Folsomia candida]|uniref:Golgi-associated plant pathogenesis-related protein 1 n=1 Tax=Folsomia candida TaxID=158441 RepID=A0A226ENI8_FOLCA|nr:uncharacterized protein LOC110847445 [Folsomia candida]OXA58778.1 Golgi-associated plant pathogenesis-related protein 1 [Folsomia candida]
MRVNSLSLSTLFIVLSIVVLLEGKKIPCPPLPLTPGVVISCELPKENKKVACTGPITGSSKRTIAKYKCDSDSDFYEKTVECKCYGKWKGLDEFQNYVSRCSTAQKTFSLSGPPELNLTKNEVEELTGNNTSGDPTPKYALDALAFHNFYRKQHGAALLKLNKTLSAFAQNWAEQEVNSGSFGPEPSSSNKTYISNMYELTLGRDDFDPAMAARLGIAKWYTSGSNYDYDLPTANAFSALMWNNTSDLGVGIASRSGRMVLVCNYWPPGNVYVVGGQDGDDSLALFRKNVFPRRVTSSSLDRST